MKVPKKRKKALEALTTPYPPTAPGSPLTMDGTAHTEFSIVMNRKYSEEILTDLARTYDPDKLQTLKDSDQGSFLKEAERQIKKLWEGNEALVTHTDLFAVTIQIANGKILNQVQESFEKPSDYTGWLKARFTDKHMRYFQQARQLARMGDFAGKYASLGKNRLLEFDRLRIALKKDPEDVLKDPAYPIPDTTQDFGGVEVTEKVDGIVTHKRFKDEGISIDFALATLLGCFNRRAVEVGVVKKIKAMLDQSDMKEELFDRIIMDKLVLPDLEEAAESTKAESLNKLLAQLDSYRKSININDARWVSEQRAKITKESLVNTFSFLRELIRKLGLNASRPSVAGKEDEK
jgi:hypothetical protein